MVGCASSAPASRSASIVYQPVATAMARAPAAWAAAMSRGVSPMTKISSRMKLRPARATAALDADAHQLGALVRVGAVAAEGEAVPQIAALELDARARLEVAGGQPDDRRRDSRQIERLVHRRLDVIEPGRDLALEVAHVDVEDGARLLVGGRAIVVMAEDALEDQRIGHAVEPQVLERAGDAEARRGRRARRRAGPSRRRR